MTTERFEWFDFVDQEAYDKNAPKWVAALRAGRYKQGEGALYTSGKYCCLGVGCKVARVKGVPLNTSFNQADWVFGADAQQCFAPVELATWLGFKIPDDKTTHAAEVTICLDNAKVTKTGFTDGYGRERGLPRYAQLVYLNDEGASFEQIADLIERYNVRARWT